MRAVHVRNGAAAGVPLAEGLRLANGYAQDWIKPRMEMLSSLIEISRKAAGSAVRALRGDAVSSKDNKHQLLQGLLSRAELGIAQTRRSSCQTSPRRVISI